MNHVVIIADGSSLMWKCEECREYGDGWDRMNTHMIRENHDWFEVAGTTVSFL